MVELASRGGAGGRSQSATCEDWSAGVGRPRSLFAWARSSRVAMESPKLPATLLLSHLLGDHPCHHSLLVLAQGFTSAGKRRWQNGRATGPPRGLPRDYGPDCPRRRRCRNCVRPGRRPSSRCSPVDQQTRRARSRRHDGPRRLTRDRDPRRAATGAAATACARRTGRAALDRSAGHARRSVLRSFPGNEGNREVPAEGAGPPAGRDRQGELSRLFCILRPYIEVDAVNTTTGLHVLHTGRISVPPCRHRLTALRLFLRVLRSRARMSRSRARVSGVATSASSVRPGALRFARVCAVTQVR
jgi:hypothetical protein